MRSFQAVSIGLPLFAFAALCGCGGGSDTSVGGSTSGTPTPQATATPNGEISSFTTRRVTSEQGIPGVEISWQVPSDIPAQNIVEYHIFRNDAVVGVTGHNQTSFLDLASNTPPTLTYNTISYSGGVTGASTDENATALTPVTTLVSPLSLGVPTQYRLRVLYQQTTPAGVVYRETTLPAQTIVP